MKTQFKEKLFSGESASVFRGMLTLFLGAGLARVVGLASIPILARIYSPEDYGVLALYTSFVALLVPFLTFRYVQAIPLPKTDVMAFNLFTLCFKFIVAGALVLLVILFFFGDMIFAWFNVQALSQWRWLIVLGAVGTALYELFKLWATRKKQYKIIAKTQFTQSLMGNLAKIGLGLLAFKPAGLIIGQLLSQSGGIFSYIKELKFSFKGLIPKSKSKNERLLAKYYQGFAWFRLPSEFLMILSMQAPILIAANLFDSNITGQLSFTMMALSLPISLIGTSLSSAYYAEIAMIGKKNPRKIKSLTLGIQKKLFLVAVPIALFIYFSSEWIFVVVFGEKWQLAGQYASILSPFLLLRFTSSPLDQVFNVISSQAVYLYINITRVVGFLVVFLFSSWFSIESDVFVVMLSWFMAIHYLFVTLLVIFLINKSVSFQQAATE